MANAIPLALARPAAVVTPRRLAAAALVATMAVAALVRLWGLDAVGFNSDEAVYSGQAASLAGDPIYTPIFSIFRAHPLGVQFLVSLVFHVTRADVAVRLVSVAFGLAAIPLVYALGRQLYSARVGLIAAAILAVLPYHVTVSRQILLDGPMMTMWLLTMYLLARYAEQGTERWLYAAAFAAGLTFLAKETGVLVVATGIAFALVTPTVRLGFRRLLLSGLIYLFAISPYPLAILIGNGSNAARSFLLWQLLRQPNHPWTFYAEILPSALGPLLLLALAGGLVVMGRRPGWRERLLLAWILVPTAFFEVWPTKGYQYLLPAVPAVLIIAARAFDGAWLERLGGRVRSVARWSLGHARLTRALPALCLAVLLASLALPTVQAVSTTTTQGSLAGTGGLPGGREAGAWIRTHVPHGAAFLTIGPTLSNLIEYYGQRRSQGLSVSPNPLRRNPAYDPVDNPDLAIRSLAIQYIALDVWSAARSPFFTRRLQGYVTKYHGQLIYEQTALTREADGTVAPQVVIRIYQVRP